jgi:membrane-associated protease RseP (regulator of RpoE activity)
MVVEFFTNNKAFVIFVIVLSVFLFFRRKKLDIQGSFPILYMLMYKTSLGLGKMKSWSRNNPRLFLYLAYFSFFVGVVGLVLSFLFMFYQLYLILDLDLKMGGGLVLPIQTQSGTIAGIPVVAPPFVEWLIALAVLVIVHEFAHGVIAQRFNIKIKSSGFAFGALFVPILPAAFVEPDEKQMQKAKWWKQISVFGAGSTSNFIFGILFYLVFVFITAPFVTSTMQVDNVGFDGVMNESSLSGYNVSSGKILGINGKNVSDYEYYVVNGAGPGLSDVIFLGEFLNLSVNESLNLTIDTGEEVGVYSVKTFEREELNSSGMIGISGVDVQLDNKEGYDFLGDFPLFFQRLIFWIVLLNIGIGIMNLLPLWITDGGQIGRTLLLRYVKNEKRAYNYLNFISFVCLLTIIFLLWPSWLKFLIGLF